MINQRLNRERLGQIGKVFTKRDISFQLGRKKNKFKSSIKTMKRRLLICVSEEIMRVAVKLAL